MFSLAEDLMERKVSLKDVAESFDIWVTVAKRNILSITANAEDHCLHDLEWAWGKGSRVEFNYEKLEMRCYGPDGQFICFTREEAK